MFVLCVFGAVRWPFCFLLNCHTHTQHVHTCTHTHTPHTHTLLVHQTVYSTNLATYPVELQSQCAPDQISLLIAHECLYYAFNGKTWIIYIWALGLLAGGQSSTMTVSNYLKLAGDEGLIVSSPPPSSLPLPPHQGTYAGQFVMEGFLDIKWAKWKRVLLTRSIAIVPCVIIAIAAHSRLDALSEWINVEQSLLVSDPYP